MRRATSSTASRVETTKKRLDNLGYFSKVETYPEDTGVAGRKDLIIQVEEKRTGSLNFGAGFSTIDSLVGFVEVTQGNFDFMNWPNFTGAGQKFRARIQYGTERKDFILSLTEPYFLDRRLSFGGQAFYSEADFSARSTHQRNYGFSMDTAQAAQSHFSSVSSRLSAGRDRDLQCRSQRFACASLHRRDRELKSQISAVLDLRHARQSIPDPARHIASSSLLTSPADFSAATRRSTDSTSRPRSISISGRTRFCSFNGEVGDGGHLGRRRSKLPIYDRLFLGGSNDLRGFDFRDVGPKDINGEPTRGSDPGPVYG